MTTRMDGGTGRIDADLSAKPGEPQAAAVRCGLAPFVLLDDARLPDGGSARLFSGLREVVVAARRSEVADALCRVRALVKSGMHCAGFAAYEAGHALEPRLAQLRERSAELPLLWFGAFDAVRHVAVDEMLAQVAGRTASTAPPRPAWTPGEYAAAFEKARHLIAAGDIYQINLTFPAMLSFTGHPLALYARLRRTQRMAHGAVVWTGREWLLSASPELFFECVGDGLTTRPMKGTAPRRPRAEDDDAAAAGLAADPKNRAENLMITDLIRNDLARVAAAGSVEVSAPFTVERYPTVHQMTTTVSARLAPGRDAFDAFAALFPCGSVTGTPKIRAMEIIDALETAPRGPYTGAIGHFSPAGDADFNVAIRTLVVSRQGTARIDVGSAIVADSNAEAEWAECLGKLAFVTRSGRPFHLIETMAFAPEGGIALLDLHIDRMGASARHFGFEFSRHEARNLLQAVVGPLREARRIKLTLAAGGSMSIAATPMPLSMPDPARVRIAPLPVPADDPRLAHKTSDRDFYDGARLASDADEVVFERADGRLTEGSFTSIFVERDGHLVTPPASDGLLPGVLRQSLIAKGQAVEAPLRRADLAAGFLLGNSLRGLFPARLVD